jgi:PhnB protein
MRIRDFSVSAACYAELNGRVRPEADDRVRVFAYLFGNEKGLIMSLSFHIDYNGRCEEAFNFYAAHLGGTIGTMLKVAESPIPVSAARLANHIMHANIRIDGVELAGADVEASKYAKPAGFYVLLGVDSEQKVDAYFDALQTDGQVILAPQETFWSPRYAIVVDKFGVPWKINRGT